MNPDKNLLGKNFLNCIKTGKSFTCTGLTAFSRLLVSKYVKEFSGKKILFITSTEQSGLKYSSDLKRLFEIESEIFPYTNISPYETLQPNFYDYQKQVKILLNSPDFVIMPVKTLTEQFPDKDFFKKNSFTLKIGDSISQKELLNKLVKLGYKRSTMVSDIGEFSIRGDIADIFTLYDLPLRMEFWGDEIVDIRFFDNETQKSVEKTSEATVFPLYKFVLPEKPPANFSPKLKEEFETEGYFEGVDVYRSCFNSDLANVLDYFTKDYIIIYDEYAEISAKLKQIEENLQKAYDEGIKTEQIEKLNNLNHFSEQEIIQKTAGYQKISLNNFLSDESNEVIDINSRTIPIFDANIENIAKFIKEKKDYKIIIATDYKERVKEILAEHSVYNLEYIDNINSSGTEIPSARLLIITDRELFNKRQKDIPCSRIDRRPGR